MAFHQPTRQSVQRVLRPAADERDAHPVISQARQQTQQQLDQSQTSWVLFSPATEATSESTVSEAPSLQTPGRSQLSDLGTLHAVGGTGPQVEGSLPATPSIVDEDVGVGQLDLHRTDVDVEVVEIAFVFEDEAALDRLLDQGLADRVSKTP